MLLDSCKRLLNTCIRLLSIYFTLHYQPTIVQQHNACLTHDILLIVNLSELNNYTMYVRHVSNISY